MSNALTWWFFMFWICSNCARGHSTLQALFLSLSMLQFVGRDKVTSYIAWRPQSSLSKQMGRTAGIKKKKKKLWLRKFYSVTIKVIELVLIKQDTWSRGEHVNVPANSPPVFTCIILLTVLQHSCWTESDMYTSNMEKKVSAIKKYGKINPVSDSEFVWVMELGFLFILLGFHLQSHFLYYRVSAGS